MIRHIFTKAHNKANEDANAIEFLESGKTLVCLADGMGGLSLGDKCAFCACEGIVEFFKEQQESSVLDWNAAFDYADRKIRALSIECKSNMGTTLTSLVIDKDLCTVAWQGNVRLYLLRDSILETVTTDHVMDIGYGQTKISRCLKGGGLRENIPSIQLPIQKGDILYLCTDGFYEKCESTILSGVNLNECTYDEIEFEDDATCIQVII